MSRGLRHPLAAVVAALLLTVPWIAVDISGALGPVATGPVVLVSGLAVLGASFLLAWGAETAEKDVPRSFAIAVLAVVAVAPEYAVDALYAWNAGAQFGTPRGIQSANLAVANMTGANRILIGVGWSGIALFTVLRARTTRDRAVQRRGGFLANAVTLDSSIATEITFLFAATMWAFLVPLNGGIGVLDTVVLVGIYVAYIAVIIRGKVTESHATGVPAYLQRFPRVPRVTTVVVLFVYSGVLIFRAVEPFAHGLEAIGLSAGIPPFFMIQWIAPLASETPELIVVAYLVTQARATAGFNALISSKLNQWTLLIGTLAVVYSIALGRYGQLPFDWKQAVEIWLTAAQSFFALAILVNFEISVREAVVLLVLFLSQVAIEFLLIRGLDAFPLSSVDVLLVYTAVYLALGLGLFARRLPAVRTLVRRTARSVRVALGMEPDLSGQGE